MSGTRRFERKLWDLANSCKNGSVQWNGTGDVIVFDFTLFKKEFLDPSQKFCKSNKIASFVRQLNLYGFKKVSNSRKSCNVHEFKHPWFARGREDWLQNVTRNAIIPNIGKKGPTRRKRSESCMQKKSRQKRRVNRAALKRRLRGRPRKSKHINKKLLESDYSFEKKSENGYLGRKELQAWPMSASRAMPSPRKHETENPFKRCSIYPYSQSKPAKLQDTTNTLFSNASNAIEAKVEERRLEDCCESKCNEFMSWQNRNEAFSKGFAPLNQEQRALPIYGLPNQENIAPMPKGLVPTTQPTIQWRWNGTRPELYSQIHGDGRFPLKIFNTNKALIEPLPLVPAYPKPTTRDMKATLDENQHVMLRIEDSYTNPTTALVDKGKNYKTELKIQNGHISKQLLPRERVETLQPCVRNISTNITASNSNGHPSINQNDHVPQVTQVYEPYSSCESINKQLLLTGRVETLLPCERNISTNIAAPNNTEHSTVNQNYHVAQETHGYESYSSYEMDCYVTQEFLDIREAYFRHYPERRRSFDGPDLRIYR